jgi:hypothetical protein
VRIRISQEIRGDHEALRGLIVASFDGVEREGVEVHLDWARGRRQSFTGRAYPQLPSRPRTERGTRYLVRLDLPSVFRNRGYPLTYRYRGLRTAPWITVADWRERLVALAAHEAFHIHQFRNGIRRSEVQAERWALRRLVEWRAEEGDRAARAAMRDRRVVPVVTAEVVEPVIAIQRERPQQLVLPGVA